MALAKLITSGVDLWLNTPQRPQEASGTSGMKAALNGVPSLSVLDGWWVEGCVEERYGWAIGYDSKISGDDSAAAKVLPYMTNSKGRSFRCFTAPRSVRRNHEVLNRPECKLLQHARMLSQYKRMRTTRKPDQEGAKKFDKQVTYRGPAAVGLGFLKLVTRRVRVRVNLLPDRPKKRTRLLRIHGRSVETTRSKWPPASHFSPSRRCASASGPFKPGISVLTLNPRLDWSTRGACSLRGIAPEFWDPTSRLLTDRRGPCGLFVEEPPQDDGPAAGALLKEIVEAAVHSTSLGRHVPALAERWSFGLRDGAVSGDLDGSPAEQMQDADAASSLPGSRE